MKRASLWLIFVAVLGVGGVVWMPRLNSELPTANQRLTREVFFRCASCGHAFGLTPPELGLMWRDVTPTPATAGKATCPKCRKPFGACSTDEADYRKGDLKPAALARPASPDRSAPPGR